MMRMANMCTEDVIRGIDSITDQGDHYIAPQTWLSSDLYQCAWAHQQLL
jgi:hypothetical protein